MVDDKKKKENKDETLQDESNFLTSAPDISVNNVREDVKHVIETMGPNTPLSHQKKYDSDTEEESVMSVSVYSSVVKVREKLKGGQKPTCVDSSDDSQMTTYGVSEIPEFYTQKPLQESVVQTPPRRLYSALPKDEYFFVSRRATPVSEEELIIPRQFVQTSSGAIHQPVNFLSERRSRLASWFGLKKKKNECGCNRKPCDLYKINIEQSFEDHSPPRRLVFDLLDELPKAETKTIGTNTKKGENIRTVRSVAIGQQQLQGIPDSIINTDKPDIHQIPIQKQALTDEKFDIYYFDHGNAEYYRTTDNHPLIKTEYLADRTEYYTKRFWAQLFGTFHIGVSFVISFILQLFRFILQAIIRPLVVGVIQLFSDYFIKPILSILFNGILQPPLIFLYNIVTSIRDVCGPVADSIGFFIREIAVIFKAIRLVQVDNSKTYKSCKQTEHLAACGP